MLFSNWFKVLCFLLLISPPMVGYTQQYAYPIPTSPNLSGNFGELRSSHFHAGIDIRTFERTGLEIHAIERGYVYRVRVSSGGYGKAIYVQHPDGNQSVYAHLKHFTPEIEAKVLSKQRQTKSWEVELSLKPNEVSVAKNEVIGFSGTTGASGGPHLHFEIRDRKEQIMNPLAFYPNVFQDPFPPFISRIAFEPQDYKARVNGCFEKYTEAPKKISTGSYTSSKPIIYLNGRVGFEFTGYDQLKGSTFYLGLYDVRLFLDDELIFKYKIDTFSYDDWHSSAFHIDFPFWYNFGGMLQRCYVEAGNTMKIYRNLKNNGIIELKDDAQHQLRLEARDFHGNTTVFRCILKRGASEQSIVRATAQAGPTPLSYFVQRGALVVKSPLPTSTEEEKVYIKYKDNRAVVYPISYTNSSAAYTVIPLDTQNLPIEAQHSRWPQPLGFNFHSVLQPTKSLTIREPGKYDIWFPEGSSPTPIFLEVKQEAPKYNMACSPVWEIGNAAIPLLKRFSLKLYQDRGFQFPKDKILLMEVKKDGKFNHPAKSTDGKASLQRMGKYVLMADTIAPTLKPKDWKPGIVIAPSTYGFSFSAYDNLAEVDPASVQSWLDGEWDPSEFYWYKNVLFFFFKKPPTLGQHTLEIELKDHVGNTTRKSFSFTVR